MSSVAYVPRPVMAAAVLASPASVTAVFWRPMFTAAALERPAYHGTVFVTASLTYPDLITEVFLVGGPDSGVRGACGLRNCGECETRRQHVQVGISSLQCSRVR